MVIISLACLAISVFFQFNYFVLVRKLFKKCEDLFSKNYNVADGLIETSGDTSVEMREILTATNSYLKKNTGTADFSLLQSIAERKQENLLEAANSRVSFPLYFGLMGTFLGVGLGLLSLVINPGDNPASANNGAINIDSNTLSEFLIGVMVAMIASFTGILLTFLNYRKASYAEIEMKKGEEEYLAFLQIELLPHMGSNIVQSLAQLKNTIGGFDTSFKSIIEKFQESFLQVTNALDGIFNKNISSIEKAVTALSHSMHDVSYTMEQQQQLLRIMKTSNFIKAVEKIDSTVTKLESINDSLSEFQKTYSLFNKSANETVLAQEKYHESLSVPIEAISRINALLNRISVFENSINSLGEQISTSDMVGLKLAEQIKAHLTNLQRTWDFAEEYASMSIEELGTNYQESLNSVKRLRELFEEQIKSAFDFSYEGNTFQFLNKLPKISDSLEKELPLMQKSLSLNNDSFLKTNINIERLIRNQEQISTKLESLSKFSKVSESIKRNNGLNGKDSKTIGLETVRPITIVSRFRKLLSKLPFINEKN